MVTKWEYLVKECGEEIGGSLESTLDHYGALGWELIAITQDADSKTLFFKMPKDAESMA